MLPRYTSHSTASCRDVTILEEAHFSRHFWEIFAAGDRSGSGKMFVCVTEIGVSDSGHFTLGVRWSILDLPDVGNVPQLRSTPCFPLISHSTPPPQPLLLPCCRSWASSSSTLSLHWSPHLHDARTHISKGARLKNHCLNNLCSTDRRGARPLSADAGAGGRSRTEPSLLVKLEYELGNVDESVKCVKSFFRDGVIGRAGERASVCPACLRLFPRVPLASIFRRVIPGHTRWLNIISPTNLPKLAPRFGDELDPWQLTITGVIN